MPKERRHAAIMFTDIVGYTALMGSDEDQAFEILSNNREIHKQSVEKFNGTLIKEIGDGMLISFNLASEAVYCAIEIQKKCKEQDIPLKIGIHEGEMVIEGADILGDAVNVASRLESDTNSGCIYISGSVYRDIKNRSDINVKYVKDKKFKNVDESIKVYQIEIDNINSEDSKPDRFPPRLKKVTYGILTLIILLLIISFFFNSFRENPPSTSKEANIGNSIAVLPFEDMSPDQDQEYLGDGIAEEIINRLTKIEDLVVIGRTSSFSFKNKDTDLKTIGEMLGVEAILEGSVQKSGDQLRITAQLIKADDASHIWSERFDRQLKDIFLLQDEIALIVANKINSNINNNEKGTVNEQVNPEAYEYFLKGKHIIYENNSFFREFDGLFPKAESMFLGALKINPEYALAHAGLADLYNKKLNPGLNIDFIKLNIDLLDSAKYAELRDKHIKKAYQINPKSDYVNRTKGLIHMRAGEVDRAYQSFVNAIKFNPEDKYNYISLAYFLMTRGLYDEAELLSEAAKKSNPLDTHLLAFSSMLNNYSGKYDKALEEEEILNSLIPDNFAPYQAIYYYNIRFDKILKAEEQLKIMKERFPQRDYSRNEGLLYAAKGDTAKALAINDKVSWYYYLLGMKKEYIPQFLVEHEEVKKGPEGRRIDHNYLWLMSRGSAEWLKEDPRTQKIIQEEKEIYELNKAKYGNLEFLDL